MTIFGEETKTITSKFWKPLFGIEPGIAALWDRGARTITRFIRVLLKLSDEIATDLDYGFT